MTNPTLERAARAAGKLIRDWEPVVDGDGEHIARAVLMAVRDDPGLMEVSVFPANPQVGATPNEWMAAMIDAILNDGEGE